MTSTEIEPNQENVWAEQHEILRFHSESQLPTVPRSACGHVTKSELWNLPKLK